MEHPRYSVCTRCRTGDTAAALTSRGTAQTHTNGFDDFRPLAIFRRQTKNRTAASRQSQALSAMGRGALGQYFALTHPRPVSIKLRLGMDLGNLVRFALNT